MKKILISFIILIFVRCANPVGPTGGDKDTKPPILQKVKIIELQEEKSITVIFDENINTKGSVTLSPITNKKNIEITKYRNTIQFKVPKTTNAFSLGDIITDVNENNPGKYPFVILGADSLKYVLRYKSPNPSKDKIKSYSLIDSFYYFADNTDKNILSYGGLKKIDQKFYIFNDNNNNDKYDIQEEYNILQIGYKDLLNYSDTFKDTSSVYLYPPVQKEIKRHVNQKDSLAIYTQIPLHFIDQEIQKENIFIIHHNDTMLIRNDDTNYIDKQITSSLGNVKIIPSKIEISENGTIIPKIGIFDKDTIIDYDICLSQFYKKITTKEFKIPAVKEIVTNRISTPKNRKVEPTIYDYVPYKTIIRNATAKYNTIGYNQNKKDSIYKRIKIKLGLTLIKIKNDSTKSYKVKFINDKKAQFTFALNKPETKIILETGIYRYIIWDDSNQNNEIDIYPSNNGIIYESILEYMKETVVNNKLDNTILVD